MQPLTTTKRAAIIQCLCEGNSIASTTRITGAAKHTILDLLAKAGEACAVFMDENLVNLPCQNVQLDEIWSFVGHKQARKGESERGLNSRKSRN